MSINNNTVYYQQDSRTPVTKLAIIFTGAGEQKETEETAGLANITAKTLFRGTKKYTRDQIEMKFDLLGASVSAAVSETEFVIRISVFSRYLDEALKLVFHILDDADFPDNEIEIVKKQEHGRLISSLQGNEEILRTAHRYILFNKKRFGKIGSKSALLKIDRSLIKNYYHNVLSAETLYVTAVSDLPEQKITELLRPFTENRPRNGFSESPEEIYRPSNGREIFIVESSDAPNDRLLWSHAGIAAADPRRFALSMIIDALGSFEGFLFDELRNKKGWCYGIYAYLFPATQRESLIAYYSDPSNSTSKFLIPRLIELLETFSGSEDFLNRLNERHASFKNRFSYQLDINYKLNSRINKDKYGIPILDREHYLAEIDAVSTADAVRTIDEIFNLKKLTMIFYGDTKRITSIISSVDPSIPIATFDKTELIA